MSDAFKKVSELTANYVGRARSLLGRLSIGTILDSTLPADISKWILDAIEELLPLMPNEDPDYAKLSKLKTQYMGNQNILRPSARADIDIVLKNLSIAHDCVLAALNADYKDLPPENIARINYDQLRRASDYVKAQLIKELIGKEDGRTCRTAMLNIYGRTYLWIQSMIKLDAPEHCLALAVSVRAILELYIDLKLIEQSRISDGAEKYFSFPTVEKWRSANSIVDMREQFDIGATNETTVIEQYLTKPENSDSNITTLRVRLWGKTRAGNPVKPKHWTNRDVRQRLELLQDPTVTEPYVSSYYWCNWCIHSMYFDMINNIKNVHFFNWHLYGLAYKMFRSSTALVNKVINALPEENLEASLNNIENETFKCFFAEMVNAGRNTNR